VRLELRDVSGRLVQVLLNGMQPAGRHCLALRGDGMASGLYLCSIQAGSFRQVQRVVLIR
jgi:hypothetical protein